MELLVPLMPCGSHRAGSSRPRSQSSAAVSADGRRWFLLNASPDVREQLSRLPAMVPEGSRHVPVEGVVLTDAELDHTVGIMLLREARHLQLCATPAVLQVLEYDSRILPVTRAFAEVRVTAMTPGSRIALCYRDGGDAGLWVESFVVPAGPPRFATSRHAWAYRRADGHGRRDRGLMCLRARLRRPRLRDARPARPRPTWCCSTEPSGPTTS